MNLHYVQHVPFENLGYILDWAHEKNANVSATHFFEDGYHLPDPGKIDCLVVMGGPMGVYDEDDYPWLAEEKRFLKTFIETGKPVLGICLGAQLLADALGARVHAGTKEIGWAPVKKVQSAQFFEAFPQQQTVMHWHGDTFDLPAGSTLLASNDVTKHQAFEYKNCLGFQFHFEMGPQNIDDILLHAASDLTDDPYVQTAEKIRSETGFFDENKKILDGILDRLFLI